VVKILKWTLRQAHRGREHGDTVSLPFSVRKGSRVKRGTTERNGFPTLLKSAAPLKDRTSPIGYMNAVFCPSRHNKSVFPSARTPPNTERSFVCCVSFDRGVILCDVCYLFVVSYCITTATG
jgi:hypothetical protein